MIVGYRPKPKTDSEAIEQLWYAVIGSNGEGLMDRIKRIEESFKEYRDTRKDTCFFLQYDRDQKEKKKTIWDTWKFLISEGIRIGTALGVFELIRRNL